MASMEWTDPIVNFKLKVIRYLKGQLVGDLFEELKDTIQNTEEVAPFYLEKCKTFEKLWEALEQRQLVKPKDGDCEFLKRCFKTMGQKKWIDRVKDYEDEIKR